MQCNAWTQNTQSRLHDAAQCLVLSVMFCVLILIFVLKSWEELRLSTSSLSLLIVFTCVYLCFLVFTFVYLCLLLFTSVYFCANALWRVEISQYQCSFDETWNGTFSSLLFAWGSGIMHCSRLVGARIKRLMGSARIKLK